MTGFLHFHPHNTRVVHQVVIGDDIDSPVLELELQPFNDKFAYHRDGNTIVVGYLVPDEYANNPLEELEGYGSIFNVRDDNYAWHEAVGRDRHTGLADLIPILNYISEHEDEFVVPENEVEAGYWDAVALEEWRKREARHIGGTPYHVMLDIYDHSGQTFSVAGEGYYCGWDTAQDAAVWVPDAVCYDEIMLVPDVMEGRWFRAQELAREACEVYNQWLSNDVWGYVTETFQYDEEDEEWVRNETLVGDALRGMYGHEYAWKELMDAMPEGIQINE